MLPAIATAAAAISLVPVRDWLQRRVSRLVYGSRAEPQRVAHELVDRLSATVRPEDMVRTVVDTIGPALGLRQAAILLDNQPGRAIAEFTADQPASPSEQAQTFPIEYQGRRVGSLEVTPARGEVLSASDRDLLRSVTAQAGLAVAAARSSAELRIAREDAVAAREQERRRLHRDLHDGLGPTLASIYQRVELAARLVDSDPEASRRLLTGTSTQVRETVADVRRLVYALRPPRLDELGLVEALRTACDGLSGAQHPKITVRSAEPLPELPAVIETTAYRMVMEAVTNAVRHSHGSGCTVELGIEADPVAGTQLLRLVVSDDGVGIPAAAPPGAGLRSLRERAAEVGGRLELRDLRPQGTRVEAALPLPSAEDPP